jgi:hypothetical protein
VTEEASRRGRSNRRKGHDFEREVAALFRELWPEAKRGLQSRGGTAEAPDVEGTPFWIEVKKGAKTNIKAALEQAAVACRPPTPDGSQVTDTRPPLAITKDDRRKAIASMYLEDFMELLRRLT